MGGLGARVQGGYSEPCSRDKGKGFKALGCLPEAAARV